MNRFKKNLKTIFSCLCGIPIRNSAKAETGLILKLTDQPQFQSHLSANLSRLNLNQITIRRPYPVQKPDIC